MLCRRGTPLVHDTGSARVLPRIRRFTRNRSAGNGPSNSLLVESSVRVLLLARPAFGRVVVVKSGDMAKNRVGVFCVRCRRRRCKPKVPAAGPSLLSGGLTVATSNPAFSRDLFPGYEQVYGVPAKHDDDRPGDGRQDVRAAGDLDGDGGMGVERRGRADARLRVARRCRHRRLHRGDDHDVQAHGRTLDGADLRRARGGLARRHLASRRACDTAEASRFRPSR